MFVIFIPRNRFASLIQSNPISGNTLYGTTTLGGGFTNGTVFKINTDGTGYTVLRIFTNLPDGQYPSSSLTLSGSTLYGTTSLGGTNGYGTVFKINTDGTGYTVLRSFSNAPDGQSPYSSLTLTGSMLYGTTINGGSNHYGTVFQMNINTFLTQPQNQMAPFNGTASFSVSAYGLTPFSYQWYFLNTNLQTTAGGTAETLSGFVYGVIVTNAGSGYTTVPQVRFIGGGGTGASGTATVNNGIVTAITPTNAGSGYTSPPLCRLFQSHIFLDAASDLPNVIKCKAVDIQ